jgi:predicted ATP-dependent endonuclease of OLD family
VQALRISSITIKNYKCHKDTHIVAASNFHTLIGANSSGKTSIIEACQLPKKYLGHEPKGIHNAVYRGVKGQPKKIILTFVIDLSADERDKYFEYLHLSKELIEGPTTTKILNRVLLEFTIVVTDQRINPDENLVLLTKMSISDTEDGEFIPILTLDDSEKKLLISDFEPGYPGRINNNPFVNKHLKNLKTNTMDVVNFIISNPHGMLQFDLMQEFLSRLRFVPSFRSAKKEVESDYSEDLSDIDEDGGNLISRMLNMSFNDKGRFKDIVETNRRIFPDILDIGHRQIGNNRFTLSMNKKNFPNEVILANEGSGLEQIFIIIWKIATSRLDSIWFLDEPELHLHPGAQKLLYDFFVDEVNSGRQIFIGTHSMVFIYRSSLNQVNILLNREDGVDSRTMDTLVQADEQYTTNSQDKIRDYIYEALGYDTTFAFEPKIVVMVEGPTDYGILRAFSLIVNPSIDTRLVRFYPLGDKNNVKNFSPILAFAYSEKNCLIVLDNDRSKPQDIQTRILNIEKDYRQKIKLDTPLLAKDNFFFFPDHVYSIEHYLLDAQAICKAFNNPDSETINVISKLIESKSNSILPKNLLKEICVEFFQEYDEVKTPVRIAENVSKEYLEQFPEIKELIQKITCWTK